MDAEQFWQELPDSDWRETRINWENLLDGLIDRYRTHEGVPHGVQKDAIQNAWDNRKDRRHGAGWNCTFELVKDSNGRTFLTIADSGTTGLTGRVLRPEEYTTDLPEDERWGEI